MNNTIYLLCVEKERLEGGVHYHPVVNADNLNNLNISCCNDLIALQNDYYDEMESIRNQYEKVMIIPVPFETYNELRRVLKETTDKAQEALTTAYNALKEAYKIMGKELSLEETLSSRTKELLTKNSSVGKCLNENLEIVDCDSAYKSKYEDEWDEEEYEEEEYEEEEYDEDEYDEEYNEDEKNDY